MWSSIGLTGLLAVLGLAVCRTVIVAIALRGTTPAERPAIIRALNGGLQGAVARRRGK